MNFVAHNYSAVVVSVVQVTVLLLEREGQTVRAGQIRANEFQFVVDQTKDAAEQLASPSLQLTPLLR